MGYKGKKYNTNTADGGDYSKKVDRPYDRTSGVHAIHSVGHSLNAIYKDATTGSKIFDSHLIDKMDFTKKGKTWSADIDRQQAEFHRIESDKKFAEEIKKKPEPSFMMLKLL